MYTQQQFDYVKEQFDANVSEQNIRQVLIENGYSEELVNELLEAVKHSGNNVTSAQATVNNDLPPVGKFMSDVLYVKRKDVLGYLTLILFVLGLIPIIGWFLVPFMIAPIIYVTLNPTAKFRDGLDWLKSNFFSYWWVLIVSSLTIAGGYLLLIIPGLILMTYVYLAQIIRIADNEKGINALVRSTQMISGVWWGVAGRVLLVSIVMVLIIGVANGIVNMFIRVLVEFMAGPEWITSYMQTATGVALSSISYMATASAMVQIYNARRGVITRTTVAPAKSKLRTLYIVLSVLGVLSIVVFSLFVIVNVVSSKPSYL